MSATISSHYISQYLMKHYAKLELTIIMELANTSKIRYEEFRFNQDDCFFHDFRYGTYKSQCTTEE